MSTEVEERAKLFSAMNAGTPFKSYKKTILAKVFVKVYDSVLEEPVELIMSGDPKKNDGGCIIDTWNEKEDFFFRKVNATHLGNGTLIPYVRKEEVHVKSIEESTDEELKQLLNSKFFTLQSKLNTIETAPILFRLLDLADEMDKSEKITNLIRARLSEVQGMPTTEEE